MFRIGRSQRFWQRVFLGMAFFGIVASAGCGGSGGGSAQTGTGQANSPIKVGFNFELTGSIATFGQHTMQGAQMALDEINAKGGILGRKLEADKLDNKGDNGESTNVTERLVSDGVVAIIGPATTGDSLGAVPVVTDSKIPMIATSATAAAVTVDPNTQKVRDWVFRVCFIDPVQGTVGADFAYQQLNARKAVIL
ncbi:MAG: ABC transporter substrate-binding protein, partial [Firmicutes bacterium]|nr:ABC transporter substrate-binding protein [Bacillota bacterium]